MYRVFLFIAFLAYCSSAPSSRSTTQKSVTIEENDDNDSVESAGAGYSFFHKQHVDNRPSSPSSSQISSEDLSQYMQSSAFKDQPTKTQRLTPKNKQLLKNNFEEQQIPRSNLLSKTIQNQQPDFSQLASSFSDRYDPQQANVPFQSNHLAKKLFDNQQQEDLRTIGSQQILLPQTNLNNRPKTFKGYGNQQRELLSLRQPQQTWNSQQQSGGFSSSYGRQGQQPLSSGFLFQSNQQNDQQPRSNAVFMSSQDPTQRFGFQSQPQQPIYGNGW